MRNPCDKCINEWLCDPYGGSCWKSRLFVRLRKLRKWFGIKHKLKEEK